RQEFANVKIQDVLVSYISDPEDKLTTELIEVSPNYYVLLAQFLPEKFNAVGVGLKPAYIEPEIEDTDSQTMENRVVQFFFLEDELETNYKLEEESIQTYRINWVEYKQKQLHDLIEEQENEIRLSRIRIENYHSA